MEIICPNCQKTYFIDDSKIPPTGKVFLRCASCKEKIEIQKKSSSINNSSSGIRERKTVEYFAPESKTALIYCMEDQARKEIEKRLAGLEFQSRIIKNQDDIRHYFRFNIFDIVIIYQHGPDPDNEIPHIMDYIHKMPSEIRRKCFVIYIYLSGNKYDLFDAFSRGVDICMGPLDIGEIDKLIPMFLEQKEINYRVFYECKTKLEETII